MRFIINNVLLSPSTECKDVDIISFGSYLGYHSLNLITIFQLLKTLKTVKGLEPKGYTRFKVSVAETLFEGLFKS